MKKPKISLRTGMTTAIVLCWLAPILLLFATFGILLGESYQRSANLFGAPLGANVCKMPF